MNRPLFIKPKKKTAAMQWLLYIALMILLVAVFASYFAPDLTVAVTNQVWALCGWQ